MMGPPVVEVLLSIRMARRGKVGGGSDAVALKARVTTIQRMLTWTPKRTKSLVGGGFLLVLIAGVRLFGPVRKAP
jgi:hypothetical protein